MHQVTKLADLLKSREHLGIRPEHAVDFVIRARQCGGIVQQRVDREGQHATGRLMSRDQKGDYLVADIGVVQRATGLLVDPRQHVVEQVWVVRQIGTGSPAFADEPVDHAVHVFDIAGEAAIAPDPQQVLAGQTTYLLHRAFQSVDHRLNEWMGRVAIEGIEPISKAAQPDSVERQRGHVARHIDFVVRIETCPLRDELTSNINHHLVVGTHRPLAEVRQQDMVGRGPIGFSGLSRKEPRPR